MKKNINRKYLIIVAIVVLILGSIACSSSTPTSEPKVSTATQEQLEVVETEQPEESPIEETAEQPTEAPISSPTDTLEPEETILGNVAEKGAYFISGVNVVDPAEPGMFFEPGAGKKLVAVNAIVGVTTGDPISVNTLSMTLIDSEGFIYTSELGGMDEEIILAHLFPGEKVRGFVLFQIPEEAIPTSLKYQIETFGIDYLEVGLTNPPEGH